MTNENKIKKECHCLVGGGTQDGMPRYGYLFGNKMIGAFSDEYLDRIFLDWDVNAILADKNFKNLHEKHSLQDYTESKWEYFQPDKSFMNPGFKTKDGSTVGQLTEDEEKLTRDYLCAPEGFNTRYDLHLNKFSWYTQSWRDGDKNTKEHWLDYEWTKFKRSIKGMNTINYNPVFIRNLESFEFLKLGFQNTLEKVSEKFEDDLSLNINLEPKTINSFLDLEITDFVFEKIEEDRLTLRTPSYLSPRKQIYGVADASVKQRSPFFDKKIRLINEKGWLFGYDFNNKMGGQYDGQLTINLTEEEKESINKLNLNKTAWKLNLKNNGESTSYLNTLKWR